MRGCICQSCFHVSDFCDPEKICSLWLGDLSSGKEFSGATGRNPVLPFPRRPFTQQEIIGSSFRSERGHLSLVPWCGHHGGNPLHWLQTQNSDKCLDAAFDSDPCPVSLGKALEHFLSFVMFWTSNQGLSFICKTKRTQGRNVAPSQNQLCSAPYSLSPWVLHWLCAWLTAGPQWQWLSDTIDKSL